MLLFLAGHYVFTFSGKNYITISAFRVIGVLVFSGP